MKTSLRVVTAPAIEPVTAAQVKLHTHIDHSTEDSLIEMWITAARKYIEDYDRRAYITQKLELIMDDFPSVPFNLPRAPFQSVFSIKYTDKNGVTYTLYRSGSDPTNTTTTASPDSGNADFIIDTASDPGRIALADGVTWPSDTLQAIGGVKIQYIAGYGDTAAEVQSGRPEAIQAIMLYCAYRNENRAGESDMPRHIIDLLRPGRGSKLIWDGQEEFEE